MLWRRALYHIVNNIVWFRNQEQWAIRYWERPLQVKKDNVSGYAISVDSWMADPCEIVNHWQRHHHPSTHTVQPCRMLEASMRSFTLFQSAGNAVLTSPPQSEAQIDELQSQFRMRQCFREEGRDLSILLQDHGLRIMTVQLVNQEYAMSVRVRWWRWHWRSLTPLLQMLEYESHAGRGE